MTWKGAPSEPYLEACRKNLDQFWKKEGEATKITVRKGDGTFVSEWTAPTDSAAPTDPAASVAPTDPAASSAQAAPAEEPPKKKKEPKPLPAEYIMKAEAPKEVAVED